jgi:HupE / UreJ protein
VLKAILSSGRRRGLLLAVLLGVLSANVAGHEIPGDVTIQAWLKPEGQRLRFVVRVPLVAMRDMEYPAKRDKAEGILDIGRADKTLHDAATLWVAEQVDLYEEDTRLPLPTVVDLRVSLPSDRSFATSYEAALAHVSGPRLPDDTELQWKEGMLDVLFEYAIRSDQSRFSINSKLNRLGLRTVTALRLVLPSGAVRAFDLHNDGGFIRLDPRWHQAALRFVVLGFEHILDGIDHLLFLFCLVIPFRRLRPLVAVITSFTVAHSVTLIASAYDFAPDALWFPPLIETLIATSIVYMALENIAGGFGNRTQSPQSAPSMRSTFASAVSANSAFRHRWMITFAFGLVHGFGFSFALRQTLQFAGSHLLTSLLSFNVGVELGQLLVLVLLVPALGLLFKYVVAERIGTIILSALVAHTAWHWMTERWGILRQFRFEWPAFDLAFWAIALRLAMVAVAIAAVIWLVRLWKPVGTESTEARVQHGATEALSSQKEN